MFFTISASALVWRGASEHLPEVFLEASKLGVREVRVPLPSWGPPGPHPGHRGAKGRWAQETARSFLL